MYVCYINDECNIEFLFAGLYAVKTSYKMLI